MRKPAEIRKRRKLSHRKLDSHPRSPCKKNLYLEPNRHAHTIHCGFKPRQGERLSII
jgi:hypothetical protein